MKELKISCNAKRIPFLCASFKNGKKSLEIDATDNSLTVSVLYDFKDSPLSLRSELREGDKADVILRDYRIELYINGELMDEEWPDGNRFFDLGDEFTPTSEEICVREITESEKEFLNVMSTFENAEGWYPENGVFVGDCMPYRKGDEYHVLYLKDRHHHRSKWGLGAHQWAHISTADFKEWRVHPMAVEITEPWEGSICTGSWIANGKTEYLYYTIRRANGLPAPICRSISADGYHFMKDKDFGFTVSEKYHAGSARDPKVVKGDDGLFHMFLTTSLLNENKGCLAHYVSQDLEKWEECGDPIYIAPAEAQPECPDYFKYNGRYYLVFSLGAKAHYMISDKPFTDFKMPENPIIPCSSVPKCAEWNGRLIFTGFKAIDGYAGTMTFKAARANKDGELIFEDL